MRLIIKANLSDQFMDQQFDPCVKIWIQDDKQRVNSQRMDHPFDPRGKIKDACGVKCWSGLKSRINFKASVADLKSNEK